MTKRDFEAIAAILKMRRPHDWTTRPSWQQLVLDFANLLARQNPRFRVEQFKRSCGWED